MNTIKKKGYIPLLKIIHIRDDINYIKMLKLRINDIVKKGYENLNISSYHPDNINYSALLSGSGLKREDYFSDMSFTEWRNFLVWDLVDKQFLDKNFDRPCIWIDLQIEVPNSMITNLILLWNDLLDVATADGFMKREEFKVTFEIVKQ